MNKIKNIPKYFSNGTQPVHMFFTLQWPDIDKNSTAIFNEEHLHHNAKLSAISWQRPTAYIKSDMVCVKLLEITE